MKSGGSPVPVFSWEMAEALAVAHMKQLGFADTKSTPSGNDKGIDAVSNRAAAQVKALQVPVGSPEVQKLRGAAHRFEYLIFYSQSGYTAQAIDFAEEAGIALFSFDRANNVKAVNARARWLDGSESPKVENLQTVTELNSVAAEAEDLRILCGEISNWIYLSPWAYIVPESRQLGAVTALANATLTLTTLKIQALGIGSSMQAGAEFAEETGEKLDLILQALGECIEMDFSECTARQAPKILQESLRSHSEKVLISDIKESVAPNFEDIRSGWNYYLPIIAIFVRTKKFLKAMNAEVDEFIRENAIVDIDSDPRFSESRTVLKQTVDEFSSWFNEAIASGDGSVTRGERLLIDTVDVYEEMAANMGKKSSQTLAFSDSQLPKWLDEEEEPEEE